MPPVSKYKQQPFFPSQRSIEYLQDSIKVIIGKSGFLNLLNNLRSFKFQILIATPTQMILLSTIINASTSSNPLLSGIIFINLFDYKSQIVIWLS